MSSTKEARKLRIGENGEVVGGGEVVGILVELGDGDGGHMM